MKRTRRVIASPIPGMEKWLGSGAHHALEVSMQGSVCQWPHKWCCTVPHWGHEYRKWSGKSQQVNRRQTCWSVSLSHITRVFNYITRVYAPICIGTGKDWKQGIRCSEIRWSDRSLLCIPHHAILHTSSHSLNDMMGRVWWSGCSVIATWSICHQHHTVLPPINSLAFMLCSAWQGYPCNPLGWMKKLSRSGWRLHYSSESLLWHCWASLLKAWDA